MKLIRVALSIAATLLPDGELDLCKCGHVAPLLISGDSITSLDEGTYPIGLVPEAEFASRRVQMLAGDRLLMVTDGVTEAMNPNGELFGMKRLMQCCRGGTQAIREAMDRFCGKTPPSDDFLIVQLTYCPPQAVGAGA